MSEKNIDYTGNDVLEFLEEARNYNNYLLGEVLKAAGDYREVMDFGAGTGTFARMFREARPDARVTCVETDPGSREKLKQQGFVAVSRPSEAKAAEFIYSLNVLEHIEDDLAALQSIREVLPDEGSFFLYVPAFQILYSEFDRRIGHFRRYRKKALMDLTRRAGFRIEQARYCDSLGFAAALAYRFVGGKSGTVNPKQVAIFDRLIFPISRILDYIFSPFLGKNLLIIARKDV